MGWFCQQILCLPSWAFDGIPGVQQACHAPLQNYWDLHQAHWLPSSLDQVGSVRFNLSTTLKKYLKMLHNSKHMKGSKERYLLGQKHSLHIFGIIPFVKLQNDT